MRITAFRSATPRTLADGALLGALAAFLLWQLGLLEATNILGPVDATGVGALIGLIVGALARQAWLVWVDAAMLAVYLLIAFTPMAAGPAARWVRDDGAIAQPVDAVIVLSSSVNADSSLDPEATERLISGLELVKAGAAPRIVTSRVAEDFGSVTVTSDAGQRRLIQLAGADRAWSVVDSVHSTHDEATRMARLLLPSGARSVALVTSPMHTRRACATFEAVGFRVHCVASMEGNAVTRRPASPPDHLAAFRVYLYERLGMIEYKARGWIKK
jgi:uncharacterized SAM-binding protein YcdF (DUF218 family)